MTHKKTRTLVKSIVFGLAIGTGSLAAVEAQATDASCFGGVVDLYVAARASASLDYLVCKTACRDATPASRSTCRMACIHDRASAVRGAREDADALHTVCDGDVNAAQRSAATTVPSACGSDLSDCAVGARVSARTCDRDSDDLPSLSACASVVSDTVDRCAADFVNCVSPTE